MNTITPLTSSTSLGSATARSAGQQHWQKYFQPGEMFKATVLEETGKDLFLLDIGGNHLTAQSKALLSPGQTLQLQMISASPQIELKIVSNTPQQIFGRSLTLIGENIDLAELFKTLQQAGSSVLKDLNKATVLEAKGNESFILDIGGSRITAQSTIPLSPGQVLQLQMVTTTPQMELKIASGPQEQTSGASLTLVGENTNLSSLLTALQIAKGSSSEGLSSATVMETKGGNIFILDIGGNRITVHSTTPLSPGQNLQLQMIQTSPQIEMRITSGSQQQAASGSLTLVGENTVLSDILGSFHTAGTLPLGDLPPSAQQTLESYFSWQQGDIAGKNGGEILKHLIDGMGLNLEKLLASGDGEKAAQTLKAALLETAHIFKDATEVADTTHRIIGTLEAYQMAQLHLENAANFIFPLPLPFLKQGYLTIENYGQKKEGSGNDSHSPLRFSLHLTLTELGNLRIDFLQYQDGMYIRFHTESKEKSEFLEGLSSDLKQAISNIPLLGISFSETAGDPTAELIQRLIPQGSSILDTKI